MIEVTDEYIAVTRGDCGVINVSIKQDDSEYTMDAEDTLELTVRELPSTDSPVLLHKLSKPGVTQIELHTEDTQVEPGRYSADIQLNHGECRYTIWPEMDAAAYKVKNLKNFVVIPGVGE